jgi:hypothetical protein
LKASLPGLPWSKLLLCITPESRSACFSSSPTRPKWDEKHRAKTYGDTTIGNAVARWGENTALCIVEEEPAPATSLPLYPPEAVDGDYIGELTHILTDGTAIPPQLVRENAKCILGSLVDGYVGFPGHEDIHLRHYTLNVSTHPLVGKGESWKRTEAHWG